MKKICLIFLCFCFWIYAYVPALALEISGECACVIDAQTGRVIYEKNARKPHTLASTTKIMTALVALENGNLDDVVTVSKNAAGTEGTSLYLKAGDTITLKDLLYGLLLQSGNDAAIAIAEHISGSVSAFAEKMTARAKALGANNTGFKNPNGLDEEGHYTTAYDLALITKEALKNETFAEIVATKSATIGENQTISNHNKLLRMYDGCVGVKTGFTKKSGRCLVSSAVRENVQVIAVTLNAPNDWEDHKKMLDYAFQNTVRYPLFAAGMTVNTVPVTNGSAPMTELYAKQNFYLCEQPDTKFQNVEVKLKIPDTLTAPVAKDEQIGIAEIYYNHQLLATVDLLAREEILQVEEKKVESLWENLKKLLLFGCTRLNFSV